MKTIIYFVGAIVVSMLLLVGYTITMGLAVEYFPVIWGITLNDFQYTLISVSLIIGTGIEVLMAIYNANK